MRFLPFISGKDFLFIYAIFTILGVILILKKLNNLDSKDYVIEPLNEDKYYVLKNNYNLYNIFYYITYKLYAKGILIKDEEEKKFYVNKDIKVYLSDIEEQVYNLYLEKFEPKNIKSTMVTEGYFKVFYDNISNELKNNGLIKNSEVIQENKRISNLGIIIILIPGIWRLIGGIISGMPVNALIIEIILVFIIGKLFFMKSIKQKLTGKGKASMNSYEKYYEIMREKNNVEEQNDNYNAIMYSFLMTNSWMYFLGVGALNNNAAFFNNSGGSCSSCSSDSSSGSSCSSCSSCGGCGGGD